VESAKIGLAATKRVASEVAAKAAADVDRNARFPREAIDELKKERLLGAFVPVELGGLGWGMTELAAQCTTLAQACA
jgi:acyl-CoA dehydrogenase